jgi:hypothetical protein
MMFGLYLSSWMSLQQADHLEPPLMISPSHFMTCPGREMEFGRAAHAMGLAGERDATKEQYKRYPRCTSAYPFVG